jgi:acetolactate synthase regulatory subunit
MEKYTDYKTRDGKRIISHEYIEHIRSLNEPHKYIVPQVGGQELALASTADIIFYGGKRGGGKSFALIEEAIKDIRNPFFVSYILRKEKDDFKTLIDTANSLYQPFGTYNRSADDMSWKLFSGGSIFFRYFKDASYEEFKDRFQGREIPYIGIDEVTQMPYKYFKYLLTCNRNSKNIRNRIFATCNPDPYSWVAEFIDWWIGEDGVALPERSGKSRYCFMDGDTVVDIIWGDTKDETYQKAKHLIDKYWKDEFYEFTTPQDMFIKEVTFIIGELTENKILLKSDPSYMASLSQQDEEQRARDLDGNWKFKELGTDLITRVQMDLFFTNSPKDEGGIHYMTCDPALEGGDNCVFWHWRGFHIVDVEVTKVDSKLLVEKAQQLLKMWGVKEENFAYDNNGLGQIFGGFFPRAVKFNNNGTPSNGDRTLFSNYKSECAYYLVQKFKNMEISIDPSLLQRRFNVKRHRGLTLKDILIKEKKAIRRVDTTVDRCWTLINKQEMKRILGWSPDFMESMITRMAFGHDLHKRAVRIRGIL